MSSKVYFASDFHLGIDAEKTSIEREKLVVSWLDQIQDDIDQLYLVGDLFDYWFEYQSVVPKGFTRLLGKLAELRDQKIPVYFFTGNHDMWMFKYFEDEFGIPVIRAPIVKEIQGKKFLIGHGDGIGPGDNGYKFIKKIFSNKVCQWMYARVHPNLGLPVMKYFSRKSRDSQEDLDFLGADKEWLIQYAEETLKRNQIDYFIFGHRHLPIDYLLSNKHSRYINLGDWVHHFSYAEFDGQKIQIKFFNNEAGNIYPLEPHTADHH